MTGQWEWAETVCGDGTAITLNGEIVAIDDVIATLQRAAVIDKALWTALADLEIGIDAGRMMGAGSVEIVSRPDGSVLVRRARQ